VRRGIRKWGLEHLGPRKRAPQKLKNIIFEKFEKIMF